MQKVDDHIDQAVFFLIVSLGMRLKTISSLVFSASLTIWQILFVSKYENYSVLHFSIVDDTVEFLLRLVYSISVCTIHNKYETLCACVIMPPERPDFVLTTNVLCTTGEGRGEKTKKHVNSIQAEYLIFDVPVPYSAPVLIFP